MGRSLGSTARPEGRPPTGPGVPENWRRARPSAWHVARRAGRARLRGIAAGTALMGERCGRGLASERTVVGLRRADLGSEKIAPSCHRPGSGGLGGSSSRRRRARAVHRARAGIPAHVDVRRRTGLECLRGATKRAAIVGRRLVRTSEQLGEQSSGATLDVTVQLDALENARARGDHSASGAMRHASPRSPVRRAAPGVVVTEGEECEQRGRRCRRSDQGDGNEQFATIDKRSPPATWRRIVGDVRCRDSVRRGVRTGAHQRRNGSSSSRMGSSPVIANLPFARTVRPSS